MGIVTTVISGIIGGSAVATSSIKGGNNNVAEHSKTFIGFGASLTASTVAGAIANEKGMQDIYAKYGTAEKYVASMSDEELEAALQATSLLPPVEDTINTKTIIK